MTTRLDAALDRLDGHLDPPDRTARVSPGAAVGHVLAAPAGSDDPGTPRFESGRRVRTVDLVGLRAAAADAVTAYEAPTVGVVPVADAADGVTAARLVEDWGGAVTLRDPLPATREPVRVGLQRDLTKDLVATVGDPERVAAGIADAGTIIARSLALDPGGTTAIGVVDGTPVIALPGPAPARLVAATAVAGHAVRALARHPVDHPPADEARLADGVGSDPGVRTIVGADLADGCVPIPIDGVGAIVRSDGWFAVPEDRETLDAGDAVAVVPWE